MTARSPKDTSASLRARLLNLARERGESFDQILVYYAIERFLCRLSSTQQSDRLVLKGAIMLRAWGTPLGRPTRDADFLGMGSSSEPMVALVRECLEMDCPDDGLVFEDEVVTEEIVVANRYPGIRVAVRGNLDGALFALKLDIGMDDSVVPDPEWVDYPTLLGQEAPRILSYSPATAVAEKFETIVSRGIANSRLKDFYDIWFLAMNHEFIGSDLSAAFAATFAHRGTDLPTARPAALTERFYDEGTPRARWSAFLSKSGADAPAELWDACEVIAAFVIPVSIAAAAKQQPSSTWSPDSGWTR